MNQLITDRYGNECVDERTSADCRIFHDLGQWSVPPEALVLASPQIAAQQAPPSFGVLADGQEMITADETCCSLHAMLKLKVVITAVTEMKAVTVPFMGPGSAPVMDSSWPTHRLRSRQWTTTS